MLLKEDVSLVGEVHCLNCGRTLAEVVRNAATRRLRLRPALYQDRLLVRVIGSRKLRCIRCEGTAFFEPLLDDEAAVRAVQCPSAAAALGAA